MCYMTTYFGQDISTVGCMARPSFVFFSITTRPEKCFGTQGIASKCVVRLLYNARNGHQKCMLHQS